MLRKLLRCLGTWVMAMYLVFIIGAAVAVAVSPWHEVEARWGDLGAWQWSRPAEKITFRDGGFSVQWLRWLKNSTETPTRDQWSLLGAHWFHQTSVPITYDDGVKIYDRWYPATQSILTFDGWLFLPAIAAPLICWMFLGWLRHRRRPMRDRPPRPTIARMVCALITGCALWVAVGAALLVLVYSNPGATGVAFRIVDPANSEKPQFALIEIHPSWVKGSLECDITVPHHSWRSARFESFDVAIYRSEQRLFVRTPAWMVILLLCLIPGLHLAWSLYQLPLFPPGCCKQCGYDLRASPGKCPECGR